MAMGDGQGRRNVPDANIRSCDTYPIFSSGTLSLSRMISKQIGLGVRNFMTSPFPAISSVIKISSKYSARPSTRIFSFCISGAGPSCLCITDGGEADGRLSRRLPEECPGWQVLCLRVDTGGAKLLQEDGL